MAIALVEEVQQRIDRLELPWNEYGIDPFGVSKRDLVRYFVALGTAYRYYFSVRHHGIEHVPERGRAMLIGNHSGGVAIDGAMVTASLLFDHEPPRLVHAMVDKFLTKMPFAAAWLARCGQLTGLPEHAERLLEEDRVLLVFPEGARGTAKLFNERFSLVDFGTGFIRLALKTGTPIVPFAFLGGGDAIPTIFNAYKLGRLLGAPYVPVTPWLLPVPLPVKMDIHYSAPMRFEGTGSEDDDFIHGYVDQVKSRIASLIEAGRRMRAGMHLLEGPRP